MAIARTTEAGPLNSGRSRQRPMPIMRKQTPHIEFSMAVPKKFLVSTACHEKHSAMSINGTITQAALRVVSAPVIVPNRCRTIAHCAAKQTSAMVATDRPMVTLDSHVSNKQILCTSARGRNDLNAQPKTYAAEKRSIASTFDALPRLHVGGS